MFEQLQASQGKNMVVELVNGRKISGTIVSVNHEYIRIQAEEGACTIPMNAIQIIWESQNPSITEENMRYVAEQLRNDENNRINCTSVPGFTCVNRYVCIPPDNCVFTFACPGVYSPAPPQGGCPAFQFQQPCGFQFGCIPFLFQCGFRFQQPCRPFQFNCSPFFFQCGSRFGCGPFQFQQPCTFQFGCTAPGGFACPGQAFIGIVGPMAGNDGGE